MEEKYRDRIYWALISFGCIVSLLSGSPAGFVWALMFAVVAVVFLYYSHPKHTKNYLNKSNSGDKNAIR